MLFGLPWVAIIPIVAIVGGLIYAYKEKELELESKRMGSSRELNDMRKLIHNLKSRVENLEAIVTEEQRETGEQAASRGQATQKRTSSKQSSGNLENSLRDIEIEDEVEGQNNDNTRSSRGKASNLN